MGQRIKGQECEVRILKDGAPQTTLTTVRSLTVEAQFDILDEGYLGETTNRKDFVKKGVDVRIQFHSESPEIFEFIKALNDLAVRRTPGARIDILATFKFPSGREARAVIGDVQFGNVPINVGSRTAYVETNFTGQASDVRFLQIA